MLLALLMTICFFMGICGSVETARAEHAGVAGYVLAVVDGAIVGGTCVWAIYKLGGFLHRHVSNWGTSRLAVVCSTLFYASIFGWMALATFLGEWSFQTLSALAH